MYYYAQYNDDRDALITQTPEVDPNRNWDRGIAFREVWSVVGSRVAADLAKATPGSWVNIAISDGDNSYQFGYTVGQVPDATTIGKESS